MSRILNVDFRRFSYAIVEDANDVVPEDGWTPLPSALSVFSHATPEERRKVRSRRNVSWYTLREKVGPEGCTRMLAAFLAEQEVRPIPTQEQTNGVYTLPMEEPMYSPGYLAVGNNIYRLQHVEVQDKPTSALRVVRRSVRDSIEMSRRAADSLLEGAQVRARNTIADAERRASRLETHGLRLDPTIASVSGVYFNLKADDSSYLAVTTTITLPVKEFSYNKNIWDAVEQPHWPTYLVTFSVHPTNKSILWRSTMIRNMSEGLHPHMSEHGACLTPGETVHLDFSSADAFRNSIHRIKRTFARVFTRVNLASLLTTPNKWSPEYLASLPEALQGVRTADTGGATATAASVARGFRREEQAQTWDIPSGGSDGLQ